MKYEVIDEYECEESLGVFDTKKEANKAIRQREKDTDGECNCHIIERVDD
jgi:hypothetical protein